MCSYCSWLMFFCFFFSSRRRHTRSLCDWSSDVCSSDLLAFALEHDDRAGPVRALRGGAADQPRRVHPAPGVPQIGRASCRERSVDLGGGRIIKKKKNKEKT